MTAQSIVSTLPSRDFRPLRYGLGAWTEHIFFAYDLLAQLKPRLLVELGTDRGESYFAFCQAAEENQTGTRCFAVDHWRGDTHAGSYDETTFVEVDAHNQASYASFSTLLRCSFDEALERFAAESIDLLHIDGHHAEEAVRHDVQSWLPKLRPGGILLLHDVAMRGRGFGVWKVWSELLEQGRSYVFDQMPGLGVWEKPANDRPSFTAFRMTVGRADAAHSQPPLLETLFAAPNESRSALLDYYGERSNHLQQTVAQQWAEGTIRFAPMANQTVIQIFWTNDGSFREEQATDARIGHQAWKEVSIPLPAATPISQLRIDFYSALTIIEIASIVVAVKSGSVLLRLTTARDFAAIELLGDCVRLSLEPFTIKVTGVDPQLHLPSRFVTEEGDEVVVQMRLRVLRG